MSHLLHSGLDGVVELSAGINNQLNMWQDPHSSCQIHDNNKYKKNKLLDRRWLLNRNWPCFHLQFLYGPQDAAVIKLYFLKRMSKPLTRSSPSVQITHWKSACFSVNTRTQKSPFLFGSKVDGTIRYSPGGRLKRLHTSRRLMKVSERAAEAWRRKKFLFRWTFLWPAYWQTDTSGEMRLNVSQQKKLNVEQQEVSRSTGSSSYLIRNLKTQEEEDWDKVAAERQTFNLSEVTLTCERSLVFHECLSQTSFLPSTGLFWLNNIRIVNPFTVLGSN